MQDPYQILEVTNDASLSEIKKSYFRLIKHHPPEKEPEKFKKIRAAYEKLKNNLIRAETDMLLFKQPGSDFIDLPAQTKQFYSEITDDDILELVCSLYSDLSRTDFNDDFDENIDLTDLT